MPSSGRPARVVRTTYPLAVYDLSAAAGSPCRDLAVGMVDEKEKLDFVKGDAAWLPWTHCRSSTPHSSVTTTHRGTWIQSRAFSPT
jgi:hypothetical protein